MVPDDAEERDVHERFLVLEPTDLSAAALHGLVEEFVSRDGTDYGAVERSLDEKVAAVKQQLDCGDVCVVFDRDEERVNLVSARDLDAELP
ncbi:MAG: YheU family protein [Myxococcota bacterium]|nr:YheU family protein [Myxococcota bacterium]